MNDKIRLNAVGDLMLGDFPLSLGFGVRSLVSQQQDGDLFRKIKPILRESDIVFGNLETVLSDAGLKIGDIQSAQMRGAPSFVDLLKDAGFTVVSVANNHAMQHGSAAFIETKELLVQNQIAPIGLLGSNGRSVPYAVSIKGIQICFLGYSLRPEKYADPRTALYALSSQGEIIEDIQLNKAAYDLVVVSVHWGDEFVQIPSHEQIVMAHSFVDAGASLVIGHHPHIIQGIEQYKKGLIAYSLGNFVSDFWQRKLRRTLILHCEFSKDGLVGYDYTGAYIDNDFRPIPLNRGKSEKLADIVTGLSNKVKTSGNRNGLRQNFYQLMVKINLLVNKIENRIFFVRNLFKYERWVVLQSIRNFINPPY